MTTQDVQEVCCASIYKHLVHTKANTLQTQVGVLITTAKELSGASSTWLLLGSGEDCVLDGRFVPGSGDHVLHFIILPSWELYTI